MSYILDALKKSEQARQQGAGAPKYSLLPVADGETPQRHVWPYVLAAGLLINAAVLYVWLQPGPSTGTPLADSSRALSPPAAPNVNEAAVALKPAENEAAMMHPAPPAAVVLQAPPARADRSAASRAGGAAVLHEAKAKAATANAPMEGPSTPAQAPDGGGKPVANTEATKPATPAPAEKTTPRKEATGVADPAAAASQGLPVVSVTGIIHGEGSNGMAIVNDKLVREGDEITPGLTLEKIQGDSVILNYKGQRFTR